MKYFYKDYNYDAWIHWNITSVCNLDCDYCFGHYNNVPSINKIDVDRLIKTLENSGRTFRISFTGGEPFLIPNIIEAMQAITKQHYISFNSNLISTRMKEFVDVINPERVVVAHASFHFEELKNRDLLDRFFENYHLLKEKGFPVHAEAVAYPAIKDSVEKIKKVLYDQNVELTFSPYFGEYEKLTYPQSYSSEELDIFELTDESRIVNEQKGATCNAGFNAFVAFHNGQVKPCFQFKEDSGSLYEKINFNDTLKKCPFNKCGCPLNVYDEKLYLDSIKEFNLI